MAQNRGDLLKVRLYLVLRQWPTPRAKGGPLGSGSGYDVRVGAPVDEDLFWVLVEQAEAESGGDCQRQAAVLAKRLAERPPDEIVAFGRVFDELVPLGALGGGVHYQRGLFG